MLKDQLTEQEFIKLVIDIYNGMCETCLKKDVDPISPIRNYYKSGDKAYITNKMGLRTRVITSNFLDILRVRYKEDTVDKGISEILLSSIKKQVLLFLSESLSINGNDPYKAINDLDRYLAINNLPSRFKTDAKKEIIESHLREIFNDYLQSHKETLIEYMEKNMSFGGTKITNEERPIKEEIEELSFEEPELINAKTDFEREINHTIKECDGLIDYRKKTTKTISKEEYSMVLDKLVKLANNTNMVTLPEDKLNIVGDALDERINYISAIVKKDTPVKEELKKLINVTFKECDNLIHYNQVGQAVPSKDSLELARTKLKILRDNINHQLSKSPDYEIIQREIFDRLVYIDSIID